MAERIFNGTDRAAQEEVFGFSLYLGNIVDGEFRGIHQGNVGSAEEAEAWVAGADVPNVLRIYGSTA